MAETPPKTILHGTLFATISKVDNIHYGDVEYISWKRVPILQKTTGLGKGNLKIYVTMSLDKLVVGQTRLLEEQKNPEWEESFQVYCAHSACDVIFSLNETSFFGDVLIGRVCIPVTELKREEVNRCVDPNWGLGTGIADSGIHVKLQYSNATDDPNWGLGIGSADYGGVPRTFFAQRKGCGVSLYQDAHVPDGVLPEIDLKNGRNYEQHRCWEDIFDAITKAKHFIYISGWSVSPEIYLKRGPGGHREPGGKLGELLKKKADVDKVKVLMLIWDDPGGFMATHAKETKKYFQGSKVNCILRRPKLVFSHHQKLLVVDSELPKGDSEKRRVVSFVGGLDLCNGRYDTPVHPLFGTLGTDHKDDFHQPNFAGTEIKKGGPREPWHDIHSRLEGEIAWDVLSNFRERWKKEGGDETLLSIPQSCNKSSDNCVVSLGVDELWNVQLFRSIDSHSTSEFWETPEEAKKDKGLVCGKHSIIDRSIQDAYIHAIRRAKNFIYIENQYFLGSSFGWKSNESDDALHLIPKELTLKIVSKIKARERFTVYVVVPMWPEGNPERAVQRAFVQKMLDYQRRTMEMMYKDIIQALKDNKLEDDPREYLTFFCLGNREVKNDNEYKPSKAPAHGSHYQQAQKARRFMIYVHSKMMIVDDEYIIVGSANINQRSMDGARDTEIAVGAYQPHHIATQTPARGQVHKFRMSLWHEHLGNPKKNHFQDPASRECVRQVNNIAECNWNLFTNKNYNYPSILQGHLLRYPVDVSKEGTVTGLLHHEHFPDTDLPIVQGAKVQGALSRLVRPSWVCR